VRDRGICCFAIASPPPRQARWSPSTQGHYEVEQRLIELDDRGGGPAGRRRVTRADRRVAIVDLTEVVLARIAVAAAELGDRGGGGRESSSWRCWWCLSSSSSGVWLVEPSLL
jgi:hypothetical protein